MVNANAQGHVCGLLLLALLASSWVPLGSCWLSFSPSTTTLSTRDANPTRRGQIRLYDFSNDGDTTTGSSEDVEEEVGVGSALAAAAHDIIVSPVLQQVYPKMLAHVEEFGNPNIPLGSSEGRQCETLRRLRIQNKLTDDEVQLVSDLGFIWHDLEDVYKVVDFDDLFHRLLQYRNDHDGDVSPPKKYAPDPELGAWVTGIRRLGPGGVDAAHRDQLDSLGFQWVSQRKCGSSFMKQYRLIAKQIESGNNEEDVWADQANQNWLRAQQLALARNDLSETRQHYLEQLLGPEWCNS